MTEGGLRNGFVEGHGFSRAVSGTKDLGFSPGRMGLGIAVLIRVTLIMLAAVVFISVGCNRQATNKTSPFPASNEVAGWVKEGNIRTFEAPDLWKYIDGEAERYLKAKVQRVTTADYKFQNKIDAVVDIYTMGNVEGARTISESESIADAKPIPLGDGARLYSQSLVFCKGSYLVRIVAYEESAEVQQAITDLGHGIEGRLARR
jgi:hypothetical protein